MITHLKSTEFKRPALILVLTIALIPIIYIWLRYSWERWQASVLDNSLTVQNGMQTESNKQPSTNGNSPQMWPPNNVDLLRDPQTGRYDLVLRPWVSQRENSKSFLHHERYYQLLSVLQPDIAVNNSWTYRAFQLEQKLRIDSEAYNYHLYPQLIDLEETVEAVRAGKPIPQQPINNPQLQLLVAPAKFCAPGSNGRNQKNTMKSELIVLVKSCVRCTKQRKKSRDTFMKSHLWGDFRIHFAFVTGVPPKNYTGIFHFDRVNITHRSHGNNGNNAEEARRQLMNESDQHKDLLIGNFEDHYYSLPIKQIFTFRWISAFCREESKLFLFIDSDFALIPHNLIRFVRSLPEQIRSEVSAGIYGQNQKVMRPIAEGGDAEKWSVSKNEIPWPEFAPYYAGAAYILGMETLTDLSVALSFIPPMRIDDCNLGFALFKLRKAAYGLKHFVHSVWNAEHLDQVTCVNNQYTDKHIDWSTGRSKRS